MVPRVSMPAAPIVWVPRCAANSIPRRVREHLRSRRIAPPNPHRTAVKTKTVLYETLVVSISNASSAVRCSPACGCSSCFPVHRLGRLTPFIAHARWQRLRRQPRRLPGSDFLFDYLHLQSTSKSLTTPCCWIPAGKLEQSNAKSRTIRVHASRGLVCANVGTPVFPKDHGGTGQQYRSEVPKTWQRRAASLAGEWHSKGTRCFAPRPPLPNLFGTTNKLSYILFRVSIHIPSRFSIGSKDSIIAKRLVIATRKEALPRADPRLVTPEPSCILMNRFMMVRGFSEANNPVEAGIIAKTGYNRSASLFSTALAFTFVSRTKETNDAPQRQSSASEMNELQWLQSLHFNPDWVSWDPGSGAELRKIVGHDTACPTVPLLGF